jgi:DNA polymerase III delta subunit
MIVMICGPDAALARAQVERIVDRHDPGRETTVRLDGRTITSSDLIAHVASPAFLGQQRVVVVSDLMARSSKPGKTALERDEGVAPSFDLAPVLNAVAAGNVLILVDATLGAIPAAVKKIAPDETEMIHGTPPRGTALLKWMEEAAEQAGSSFDSTSAQYLAERLFQRSWTAKPSNVRYDRPPDLDLLRNEIEKLASAAHPHPIQARHIDMLTRHGAQDQIFRFTDAVARRQMPVALRELTKLVEAGEEPYRLTAQMYQQVELATVLDHSGTGRDPLAIGRDLDLANPNRMASIAASRRSPSGKAPIQSSLRTDRLTKRGHLRSPEDAIFHMLSAGVVGEEEDDV